MPEDPYVTLRSEYVWRNRWYSVRRDAVRFPDGSEGEYNVVERGSAVFIVPELADGRLALIRNYRYTIRRWLWEVPAGGIEDGEQPATVAARELAEEIGGQAESLEQMGSFYTAPGFCDALSYIFLARGVTLGQPRREASEVMEVHLFTADEVLHMIRQGDMQDGPSSLSVLMSINALRRP